MQCKKENVYILQMIYGLCNALSHGKNGEVWFEDMRNIEKTCCNPISKAVYTENHKKGGGSSIIVTRHHRYHAASPIHEFSKIEVPYNSNASHLFFSCC